MSSDSVDDLHAAEDFAGLAVKELREIVKHLGGDAGWKNTDGSEDFAEARRIIEWWDNYCRPTCNFLESADGECDDDNEWSDDGEYTGCCGCPCDHEVRGFSQPQEDK